MLLIYNKTVSYVYHFQKSIHTYTKIGVRDSDYGRTWIVFPSSGSLAVDQLFLYNGAHLALEPASEPKLYKHTFITEGFNGEGFVNDASKLGTIHVGPSQLFTVRYWSNFLSA